MENEISMGQLIEKRRKELKIPKVQLAQRVGISRQYLGKIIFEKNMQQLDLLRKICVALNCDFFQHFCLVKNETIVQNMQTEIERNKNIIAELRQQIADANKIIAERNFAIDILRGK